MISLRNNIQLLQEVVGKYEYKMKFIYGSLVFAILLISLIGIADSFAVGSSYWPGNSLEISPGETKIVELKLQNMVGKDNETVRVKLDKGGEVASLEEKDYLVPLGTREIKIPVQVSIPSGTEMGSTHTISISFSSVQGGGGQGVSLGVAYSIDFDAVVKSKVEPVQEEKGSNLVIISVLVVVILIVLIGIIIVRKRKKKSEEVLNAPTL